MWVSIANIDWKFIDIIGIIEKVRTSTFLEPLILNLWEHFTQSWKSCVSGVTAVKLGGAHNKKCTFVVMGVDKGIN